MADSPMDLLSRFPVRKTSAQKTAFLQEMKLWAENAGYCHTVEKGSFGCRNLILGDAKSARYLITAHYDTAPRMLFPNFLTPCNALLFTLYQIGLTALILLVPLLLGIAAGFFNLFAGLIVFPIAVFCCLYLMLFGPANPSNLNDNTSGVLTLMEIAASMPANQRSKVCFVLFDLEEVGLVGSAAYRSAHRAQTDHQLVFNLDCVGDGDFLRMFPTKQLKKDAQQLTSLYRICGYFGKKSLLVQDQGFAFYPSDHMSFPWGVGIGALHKGKKNYYLGRVHTPRDTILEQTNVNLLRAAIISYVSCSAVQNEKGNEK